MGETLSALHLVHRHHSGVEEIYALAMLALAGSRRRSALAEFSIKAVSINMLEARWEDKSTRPHLS
jgi:hypothetical protein